MYQAWLAVSVPLRGKYCRELGAAGIGLSAIGGFPSPCGVNIVGNRLYYLITYPLGLHVSVPLRGKYCRE